MAKYVFKNPEVEEALRFVSKELGVSDERFDRCVEKYTRCASIFIEDEDGNTAVEFPTTLLVKKFNPYGWNDANVEPVRDSNNGNESPLMLVEDLEGIPHQALFIFDQKEWIDSFESEPISVYRYRLYPED